MSENVSPEQVATAARIQVVADKKSGRQTPEWVRQLAESAPEPSLADVEASDWAVAAARIQVAADRKSGRKTDERIRQLASHR